LLGYENGEFSGEFKDSAEVVYYVSEFSGKYIKGELLDVLNGDLIDYENGALLGYLQGDLIDYMEGELIGHRNGEPLYYVNGEKVLYYENGEIVNYDEQVLIIPKTTYFLTKTVDLITDHDVVSGLVHITDNRNGSISVTIDFWSETDPLEIHAGIWENYADIPDNYDEFDLIFTSANIPAINNHKLTFNLNKYPYNTGDTVYIVVRAGF